MVAAEGGSAVPQDAVGESTQLGGEYRLELTRFTAKQYWIDEKIQLLNSLPPIDAFSPLPPDSSSVDRTQLSGWYEEFAVIEQMVEDYDLGDLASLRKFAASSSKRDLSNEDTDLLEVTLTTLLSLDRLLSLLRHRHQQLDLLTYRIRWEEQLGLAWKEYRRILADLPPLIQRSRWTRPAVATNPQSTTFHESLSADLVAYTSHIDALLNSTIPAAAHHLDKIIDTSPVALPDSFLESQESLEDAAGDLTTGLGTFIGKVGRQTERLNGHWRGLEGIGRSLEGVERALNGIGETGMPLGEYDVYAIPLGVARTDLDRIKAETKEFAASLFHPAVPDQATNTTDVLSVIFARHEELVAISDTIAQRLAGFQHDAVLLSEKVDKEETVRLAEEDSERRTREEGDLAREMSEARMYSFRHSVELIKIEEFDHVLPSLIQLDDLIHQVSLARTLYEPLNPAERNQVLESHLELERKESHLATLQSLIKLGEMVVLVDHAISDLLESIDVANGLDPLPSEIDPATPTRPLLPLDVARTHAIDSVDAVRSEAATIDDMRSIVQLTRLEGILAEMLEFADEAVVPRPPVIFEHSVDSPRPSSIRARSISASSSRPPSSRASSRLSLLSTTEEGRCETTLAGNDSIFTPTSSRSIITPPPRSQIPRQSLNKSNGMHTALEIGIGRPGGLSRSISNSGSALGVPTSSASAMGMKRSTRAVSSPSPRVGGSSGSIGSMGRPRVASNESTRSNRASLSSSASRASLSGGMGREKEKVGPVRFVPRRKDRVVDIEVARIISENSLGVAITPADDASNISGKYWIGDEEPRLYFIRILRSKTAMVRVGGGWMELSLFLSKHYGTTSHITSSTSTKHPFFPTSISLTSLSLRVDPSLSTSYSSNSLASSTNSLASSMNSMGASMRSERSERSIGSLKSGGTASPVRSRKGVGGSGTPRWRS